MKNNYLIAVYTIVATIILCSCEKSSNDVNNVYINLDEVKCAGDTQFFEMFADAEFIPLENKKECMIAQSRQLVVSDSCFLIFERHNQPNIYKFDNNGKFIRIIGRMGHAKSEYQDGVLDICSNKHGDTIAVSTLFDIKMYDGNGQFLCSKLLENAYGKNIISTNHGFVFCSNYSANKYSVHFLNSEAEIVDEMIGTDGLIIGKFGITKNALRCSESYLYYYDQYKSHLYQINLNDHRDLKRYNFISKNMVTPESFMEENNENHVYDAVCHYHVFGDQVWGQLTYRKFFVLNTRDNSMKMKIVNGWYPYGCETSFEGYVYYLINQEDFLKIGEDNLLPESIKSNYYQVLNSVNEKSNSVIMKLKLREDELY